jgi:hypothetical protein
MLITLKPSEPSVTNTTTTTPSARRPTAISRRNDHGSLEEPFVQIGEIKAAVFGDVGEALWFIPNDLHRL